MIELNNITFSYTRKSGPALSEVTAALTPGVILLAGENGAGKTTLLHIIAGLARPTCGECLVGGVPSTTDLPSEMGRSFLLEERSYFPGKTIRKFAELHSRFYPRFSPEMFLANLMAFGLTGDEPMKLLSLGNRKKAQLAYALALGVDVLLLDEPTNGLDIESKETLRKTIAGSLRDRQTIIVSTHTVSELENLFDGVMFLSRGELVYAGSEEDVSSRLAFEVSRVADDEALYTEIQMGRVLSILPATADCPTRVDWRMLYSALRSSSGEIIKDILHSEINVKSDDK